MEIHPRLQLAMLLVSLLWGLLMGALWELLTASRILLGAYEPPKRMRGRYEKPLPLLHRPVPFARKNPLRRLWRGLLIALGDLLFCLALALSAVLILYRYNSGILRLSVPVLLLLGLGAFRLLAKKLPLNDYFAYTLAAGRLYLLALLGLLCRPLAWLARGIKKRRAAALSARLCKEQLLQAALGFEKPVPQVKQEREKKRCQKRLKDAPPPPNG